MWLTMPTKDRLSYLNKYAPVQYQSLSRELVATVEEGLNHSQRIKYADYVSTEVAANVYAQNDPQDPSIASLFYFEAITFDHNDRARLLWHVLEDIKP